MISDTPETRAFRSYFHCDDQTIAHRVNDNSMINAGITRGDLVIVRLQSRVSDGEIALITLGDTALVRRLCDLGKEWFLNPESEEQPTQIRKDDAAFKIHGKVIGVVRSIPSKPAPPASGGAGAEGASDGQ